MSNNCRVSGKFFPKNTKNTPSPTRGFENAKDKKCVRSFETNVTTPATPENRAVDSNSKVVETAVETETQIMKKKIWKMPVENAWAVKIFENLKNQINYIQIDKDGIRKTKENVSNLSIFPIQY